MPPSFLTVEGSALDQIGQLYGLERTRQFDGGDYEPITERNPTNRWRYTYETDASFRGRIEREILRHGGGSLEARLLHLELSTLAPPVSVKVVAA